MQKEYNDLTRLLGETTDRQILLERFVQLFVNNPLSGKLHYIFTLPGEKRCVETLYTLRLCLCEVAPGEAMKTHGAFDGILCTRDIHDQDIFCGSYNAVTEIKKHAGYNGGFSIVFHTHHIRLHYVKYQNGKTVQNICCYTENPASGALLQMIQALDIVLHDFSKERDAICRPLIKAILQLLYQQLQTSFEIAQDNKSKLAGKIKYHLECNFFKPVNCSVICDELNVSRSYASQIFHQNFGITMNDYLLNLRLGAASRMLASQDNLKICDIASLCGFQDAGYFSRVFRSICKCTPQEYRKKQKNATASNNPEHLL